MLAPILICMNTDNQFPVKEEYKRKLEYLKANFDGFVSDYVDDDIVRYMRLYSSINVYICGDIDDCIEELCDTYLAYYNLFIIKELSFDYSGRGHLYPSIKLTEIELNQVPVDINKGYKYSFGLSTFIKKPEQH